MKMYTYNIYNICTYCDTCDILFSNIKRWCGHEFHFRKPETHKLHIAPPPHSFSAHLLSNNKNYPCTISYFFPFSGHVTTYLWTYPSLCLHSS